ncbi:phage tail protein [Brenneria uluponensis]|uniref:phage tail protein n=1 Tax=Brenneria uluponensis TaxID=3057057 RepID=UPI0028ED3357|nr:phage tail protein [Brenneria ulupoensis]
MHRIDTNSAQADKFGVGKNGFTEGNPQTGEAVTALSGAFFDAVQEEISGVIEGAGLTLNKGSNYQLWAALQSVFAKLASPALTGVPTAPTPAQATNSTQIATTEFVQSELNSSLVGIPLPWPQATAPTGWLKCNGQAFNTTLYPKLATIYPSGTLPDLRGEFIRGWDDGRGVDSGRTILSQQSHAMQQMTGCQRHDL